MQSIFLILVSIIFISGCSDKSSNYSPKETTPTQLPVPVNNKVVDISNLSLNSLEIDVEEIVNFGITTRELFQLNLNIIVQNNSLQDQDISFSGLQNGFYLKINRCPNLIPAKKQCEIVVSFSSRGLYNGVQSSNLVIESGMNSLSIPLFAEVSQQPNPDNTGTPELSVIMSADFSQSLPLPSRKVYVENIGDGSIKDFKVILPNGYTLFINRCSSNLKPGASCSMQVAWKDYRTIPAPRAGMIEVSENGNPSKTINLKNGQQLVDLGSTIKSVAIGNNYLCGTKIDGTAYCSGKLGMDGMFGDYSYRQVLSGNPPGEIQFYQGLETVCFISSSTNQVFCAGDNQYGQMAIGDPNDPINGMTYSSNFIQTGFSPAKSMVVGLSNICIIRLSDDLVECSGNNTYGMFGAGADAGSNTPQSSTTPVLTFFSAAKQISGGGHSICIINQDDNLECAGLNYFNNFGYPSLNMGQIYTPIVSQEFVGIKKMSFADSNGCAMFLNGKVKCGGQFFGDTTDGISLKEYPEFENADEFLQVDATICGRKGPIVKCASHHIPTGILGNQSIVEDCVNNRNCPEKKIFTLPEFSNAKKLMLTRENLCIINGQEEVVCSGVNSFGKIIPNAFLFDYLISPVVIPEISN